MRLLVFGLLFLVVSGFACGQDLKTAHFMHPDYPYHKWKAKTLNRANTFNDVAYMSYNEKMVVFYINLARLNGRLFARTFLKHYVDSFNIQSPRVGSLTRDLRTFRKRQPLFPKKDLYQISKNHAIFLSKSGKEGHHHFNKRFGSLLKNTYLAVGENCDYGSIEPLDIVMSLLIDEGNKKTPNRNNMLRREFDSIGLSIQIHRTREFTCVIDFGESEPPGYDNKKRRR